MTAPSGIGGSSGSPASGLSMVGALTSTFSLRASGSSPAFALRASGSSPAFALRASGSSPAFALRASCSSLVLPFHRLVPGLHDGLVVQPDVAEQVGGSGRSAGRSAPALRNGRFAAFQNLVGHGVPHVVRVIAVGVVLAGVATARLLAVQ